MTLITCIEITIHFSKLPLELAETAFHRLLCNLSHLLFCYSELKKLLEQLINMTPEREFRKYWMEYGLRGQRLYCPMSWTAVRTLSSGCAELNPSKPSQPWRCFPSFILYLFKDELQKDEHA